MGYRTKCRLKVGETPVYSDYIIFEKVSKSGKFRKVMFKQKPLQNRHCGEKVIITSHINVPEKFIKHRLTKTFRTLQKTHPSRSRISHV